MKLKKLWAGMAVAAVSVSGFVGVNAANAAPVEPTTSNAINDVGLKIFLNTEYFDRHTSTDITAADLETLTEIDTTNSEKQISSYVDSSPGYVDISGLRYATNLKKIDLNKENEEFNNFVLTDRRDEESANYFWNELNMIKSLEELNISQTQIRDPNNGIILDLPNLTTITAMENHLGDLDYLSNLPNLTNLNLRNNSIVDSLAFLEGSPNLVKLDLAGNYGYTWDEDVEGTESVLSQLDKLESLDISYNSLNENGYNDYLIDAIIDMDSLQWFNYEGNTSADLRKWEPVADKVGQTSFANQQLSSYSYRNNIYDGSSKYDLNFYGDTYYDVDGVEYTLNNSGGLLYDYIDGYFFTAIHTESPVGEFAGDRANSSDGQSYNKEQFKEINSESWLYYGFGNDTTRGSFGFQHIHDINNEIGILPENQSISALVGDSVETQPLTVINSDDTVAYSTTNELPAGLTLDSETGVISGIAEEEFNGSVEIIPEFSESVSYNRQITIQFVIGEAELTEPVVITDLPNGKVGVEYNGSITTDSGEITGIGGFPNGLTYDMETGIVSGVPTVDGEFGVSINVMKDDNYYGFMERLTIDPADVEIITPSIEYNLPAGQVGSDYEGFITVDDGDLNTVENLPEGLNIDLTTGIVSGVPANDGEFEIVITAVNGNETVSENAIIIINKADVIIVAPTVETDLPNGQVGVNYEGSITTDVGEITTVDGLPNGLTFNLDNGVVSGVPTVDGLFEVSIVANNNGSETNVNEVIIINEADIVEPIVQTNLPNGQVGVDYKGSITIDNLNGQEYTVSNLPDGLSYNYDTGVVSGIPTNPAVYQVEVAVNGNQYVYEVIIAPADTVDPVLPNIVADLPDGQVGQDYIGSVIVENGEITNTTGLPEGLTINFETGDVSGIPTTDGEFDVVITAENSDGETIVDQTILINPVDEEPVVEAPVVQTDLPDGFVNEDYEGSIIVEPGEITDVVGLPDGLVFNPDNGSVIGVPTNDGEFEVVITAENDGSEITLTETIVIEVIIEDDEPVVPGEDDSETPPVVDDNSDNEETPVIPPTVIPDTENGDTTPVDEPVKPTGDKPDKKVNSGELSEVVSSPIIYVLSAIIGFGLLVGLGFIRLRNKNN